MGKKLICNSLSFAITKILEGDVKEDDIDKIYSSTCLTEEDLLDYANNSLTLYSGNSAFTRAEKNIAKKYGYEDIDELYSKDADLFERIKKEIKEESKTLRPVLKEEAKQLVYSLWNSNKIIQTRYTVPENETRTVTWIDWNGKLQESAARAGDDVTLVNGQLYRFGSEPETLGKGSSNFFNNEGELIADQIFHSRDSLHTTERLMFIKKMFPNYADVITKLEENENWIKLSQEDILRAIEEKARDGEHTIDEVADGIKNLTQSEIGEALNAITNIDSPTQDKQK